MPEVKQQQGRITLKDVRGSFLNLFEPKAAQAGGKEKYSGSFIFAKNHPQVGELQKLIVDVATAKWGAKAMETLKALKAGDRLCMHDGDAKSDRDGYAGNLFINASNDIRPMVVDGNRAPLTAADGKPYSGCYVNVILQVWAQDNSFGKRVNASLLGVQFLRDGERMAGGGVAAAEDFEPVPQAEGEKTATAGAAGLF